MISLRNITKRYGAACVLDNISLDIPQGAYVTLLGPSGSGKSTLLRCIAGLVKPDEGSIAPFGDLPAEKRNLGMVFQSYAVWPHMSVLKNVSYRVQEAPARAALARVGLASFADRAPDTLSGGQQQRVALARALAMNPRALLLDEPLANLDPHLRADLCDELRSLRGQRTFIHVTHDRDEALGLATHLVVLRNGRLEQVGTPDEVFLHPKTAFVAEFVAGAVRVGTEHLAQLEEGDEFRADVVSAAYAGTHYNCTVRIDDVLTRVRLSTKPGATVRLAAKLRWTLTNHDER